MLTGPKKSKFRKAFKGRIHGVARGGFTMTNGSFGLKALEAARITAKQIEAARKAINNFLKRKGKLWIKIFPDIPVTRKPVDTRMGSGKGYPEFFIFRVKPGRVLFELSGVTLEEAEGAFQRAQYKLPMLTKFVLQEKLSLV